MSGGTDGTFLAEQQKFFNCPPGRGVYLPLASLQPDTRFMDSDIVMESIRDNRKLELGALTKRTIYTTTTH